jgi:hypothetical protein
MKGYQFREEKSTRIIDYLQFRQYRGFHWWKEAGLRQKGSNGGSTG